MSRKILGLDIGKDAVSAVLIDSGMRENYVVHFTHIPLLNCQSPEKTNESLLAALNQLKEEINLTGAACVAAFPSDLISYRNIKVPFKDAKKIAQILPFELETMLPFSIEDLIIDFKTLPIFQEDSEHTEVMTLAVEKARLAEYLRVLSAAGLDPQKVTVSSYAASQILKTIDNMPQNALLMDLREQQCTLLLIKDGKTCLMRTFVCANVLKLCQNIKQTLASFEAGFSLNFQPKALVMTGHGLEKFSDDEIEEIEEILDLAVWQTDIVQSRPAKIKNPPTWNPDKMDGALCLALAEVEGKNRINFRRGEFTNQADWAAHKSGILRACVFAVVILALVFLNLIMDVSKLETQASRLNQEITQIFKNTFPNKPIVEPVHQMRIEIETQKKQLPKISNIRAIDVLNTISQAIPSNVDMSLTHLVTNPDNILINGETDAFNTVNTIQTQLKQAFQKAFGEENLKEVKAFPSETIKATKRVRFKFKVEFKKS